MTKLGIIIGEDNQVFFNDILEDLGSHFEIEIYRRKTYNLPIFYSRLNWLVFREGIRSLLRNNEVCFFEWASERLMVASQMPKTCAIVTRLHSFELFDWAPKINWEAIDKVILVSKAMQRKFIDIFPEHADKTGVIYNGVSLEKFRPPTKRDFKFNLGMLCNIVPIKRVYEVILMFYSLKMSGYDAQLFIAGPATDELRYISSVHRLIKKLNLSDRVILEGTVKETNTWLHKIDIFISNSYWEGQPISLLEAMATGCFCLSHIWDGAEEILPQENLYVIDADLMQKIVEYAEKVEVEKSYYQAQMRAIAEEKFDIKQTSRSVRHLIDEFGKITSNI
jgi:glycosyltransferase involved in cell wall biosynthesis